MRESSGGRGMRKAEPPQGQGRARFEAREDGGSREGPGPPPPGGLGRAGRPRSMAGALRGGRSAGRAAGAMPAPIC